MNRVHVETALEGAHRILPDPFIPGMEVDDDEWGAAISVGKVLQALELESIRDTNAGQTILDRTRAGSSHCCRPGR